MGKGILVSGEPQTVNINPGKPAKAGDVVVIGSTVGVLMLDVTDGRAPLAIARGVFRLPKRSGVAIAYEELCYWDEEAQVISAIEQGNTYVGPCVRAAGMQGTTVDILLGG